MTPDDFLTACVGYFGDYPREKPGIRKEVSAYVATKGRKFLGALWWLVRDERPHAYGPPDMASLLTYAERAGEYAATHIKRRALLDDGERAKPEEAKAILEGVVQRMREKMAPPKNGERMLDKMRGGGGA